MPYLSTLEVCSWQGAIQIHVYLTLLPLLLTMEAAMPLLVMTPTSTTATVATATTAAIPLLFRPVEFTAKDCLWPDTDSVLCTPEDCAILQILWNTTTAHHDASWLTVSAVCCTGYYQLQQLCPLVWCLSEDAAKTLIQTFISTRLDYCNSLYLRIADGLMLRLQSVQNAAARLIIRAHHASPTSAALAASLQTSGLHPCLSFIGWYHSRT